MTLERTEEAPEDDLIDAFATAGGTQVGSLRFSRMEPRGCCARTAGFGGINREASSVRDGSCGIVAEPGEGVTDILSREAEKRAECMFPSCRERLMTEFNASRFDVGKRISTAANDG